ncbi:ATP-grasp fold amidoligase family protein [Helicobacter bilis]|uniref:ATP-grasp fold amidoligase family protein n=1 Tax=Helicobacter bilis TaxID=37372 RepID=UPI0030151644
MQNLETTQNTLQNPIPNQATQNLNSLLAKDSLLFQPIDTLTQELFNANECQYLPKLYGIYKSVNEIDFSKLPQSFVLKTNHDCGGVVLVKDKDTFLKDSKSFNEAITKLTNHLNTNFYTMYREWHYKDIEPRIFAEEMLGDTQKHSLIDYKIHTMQNIISHIEVITDRHTGQKEIAMDTKWHKVPFDYEKKSLQIPQKPIMLGEMLDMSLLLAQAFQYVRVDLYCVEMNIYVGELTFTPAGGTDKFTPQEWDKKLGDLWKHARIE